MTCSYILQCVKRFTAHDVTIMSHLFFIVSLFPSFFTKASWRRKATVRTSGRCTPALMARRLALTTLCRCRKGDASVVITSLLFHQRRKCDCLRDCSNLTVNSVFGGPKEVWSERFQPLLQIIYTKVTPEPLVAGSADSLF